MFEGNGTRQFFLVQKLENFLLLVLSYCTKAASPPNWILSIKYPLLQYLQESEGVVLIEN